ncbi:hypothetical protein LSAT2_013334 [Lamellibrachia satsuma]|nr:hypothetical protein LSAT2_013334 [Lamellibrachia satsuma]
MISLLFIESRHFDVLGGIIGRVAVLPDAVHVIVRPCTRATSRGVISVMTRMIADEDNRTVEHRSIEQTGGVAATPHVRPTATSSRHIDEKLACAAARALHDGCLTPIIKEELRLTIQSKRLKRGQNEMSVSFRQPAPEQLTDDETERRRKRRENNKLAAQKCRAKRRERAEALEREADILESQNNELRDQILALERERNRLHEVFHDHSMCGGSSASGLAPDSPEIMDLTS